LLITTAWSIYCSVTQLFVIFIAFGQLDLLLVRLASDLFANFFTLNMYLDGKIYDPDLHAKNLASQHHASAAGGGDRRIYTIGNDEGEDEPPHDTHDDDSDSQEVLYSRKKPVLTQKTKTVSKDTEEMVELIFENAIEDHPKVNDPKEVANASVVIGNLDDEKTGLLSKK
jgi:hypothetical protein